MRPAWPPGSRRLSWALTRALPRSLRRCAIGAPGVVLVAALVLAGASIARATPLGAAEVAKLCAEASDPADCGRRVEAAQMARHPGLAVRDGDRLALKLGSGDRTLVDSSARAYALWGYLAPVDALVVYTVAGGTIGFTLVLRRSGAQADLDNEPVLSPDAAQVATADFCSAGCAGEIAIWRIDRGSIRKDRYFRPRTAWNDVAVRWKDPRTLVVERRTAAAPAVVAFDFRLTDPGWIRIDGR
jgi:hypothetical protein